MCYFREIEMCHFREIEMCHIREITMCHFREIEMCHFQAIKIIFQIKTKIQFSGDWNVHLEIMLLEFLFIKLLVSLKTILKAILKTILIIIIIFLLLFYYPISYGERSSTIPLRFFVRNFFFCKSYNLEFFWILFLCFETFFG